MKTHLTSGSRNSKGDISIQLERDVFTKSASHIISKEKEIFLTIIIQ